MPEEGGFMLEECSYILKECCCIRRNAVVWRNDLSG